MPRNLDLLNYEEREVEMRRVMLLLAVMALALLLGAGVVLAAEGVKKKCPGNCTGTSGDDLLTGSNNNNVIKGLGGADRIIGKADNDHLLGEGGGDAIYGGIDSDVVNGGPGNDYLEGDFGKDTIIAGNGSDEIAARDGFRDIIYCGDGNKDKVYFDSIDVLHDCERTLSKKPSPPA